MYIKRTLYNNILEWKKDSSRKPLLLRGARQVGKSRLVQHFGEEEFSRTFTFNFEEDPSLKNIFQKDLDAKRIIAALENKVAATFNPQKDLIFFDEIQQCPQAITALRYFYEKCPEFYIIAAGSLLEFALEKISFPVGRVETLYLYPVSFSEFLVATGREMLEKQIPSWSEATNQKLEPVLVSELYKALEEYLVIGGMPEAVSTFITKQSVQEVFKVQNSLLKSLIDDTRKYTKGDLQLENIATVLQRIPKMIGQEITYTTLGAEDKHTRTKKSLQLLNLAMVCTMVKSTSPVASPLSSKSSEKHFKCLFLDVGLAGRFLGIQLHPTQLEQLDKAVYGQLLEQFVGQELLCHYSPYEYRNTELYCWIRPQKSAKAEVDYIVTQNGKNIPIEVKNSAVGKIKSLQVLLKEYPSIDTALVLAHIEQSEVVGCIRRVPLFVKF